MTRRGHWRCLRDTGAVLVDASADPGLEAEIREAIEDGDAEITDLHVWRVGPGKFAAIVSLIAAKPLTPREDARRITIHNELVHLTVKPHICRGKREYMPHAA